MNNTFIRLLFAAFSTLVGFGHESNALASDRLFFEPSAIVIADATFIKILFFPHSSDQGNCGPFKFCYMYQLEIKDTLLGTFNSKTITVINSQEQNYKDDSLKNWLVILKKNDVESLEYRFGAGYFVARSSFLLNGEYCFYFEQKELGKGVHKGFMHNYYWCYAKNKLHRNL